MMVISRTPFRVSLVGGGSDLRAYYARTRGAVMSMAINRYMYVTVNRRFDASIRVSYSKTEIVDRVGDLQHDLIREAMRRTKLTSGIEITTIADLPAGIGLGSSSSLAVGVLNALYAFKGEWRSADELARDACELEIETLGRPIGKQDQYIAAYGGFQLVEFLPDERVLTHPVVADHAVERRLVGNLQLYYSGMERDAGNVLKDVRHRLTTEADTRSALDQIVAKVESLRAALAAGRPDRLGALLDESWTLKKQTSSSVSNATLDRLYTRARRAGAVGGKVAGAGGGGCLLLYVLPSKQDAVRRTMLKAGLREIAFDLEPEGSRIVHFHRGERRG